MLKLLGAALLLSGGVWLGLSGVRKMEQRVKALRAMSAALELIGCELDFSAPPLRELFERTAAAVEEPAASFFRTCAEGIARSEGRPLAELWRNNVEEYLSVLKEAEKACLISAGTVLGRYDVQSQRSALIRAREQLDVFWSDAVRDRQQKGRIYGVLGAAAGSFLVILLL